MSVEVYESRYLFRMHLGVKSVLTWCIFTHPITYGIIGKYSLIKQSLMIGGCTISLG